MLAYQIERIEDEDFRYFQEVVLGTTGINLTPVKRDLLESRLCKRIHELGLTTFSEYRRHLGALSAQDEEWQTLVNLITTNKTDFFREPAHFEFLIKSFLPSWKKQARGRPLQAWSAACSTGEEPYTLAMVLAKYLGTDTPFEIKASDIDTQVLAYASNGVYPKARIEQIPADYRRTSVAMGTGAITNWGKIRSEIKRHMEFKQCNLIEAQYPWDKSFDLILCRNVFIYFKTDLIERIVRNMYRVARPGALLMIGHTESLHGLKHEWKLVGPSIFQKVSSR